MRYRIEYTGGRCKTIDGSRALIRTLKQTDKPVSDVRKVFQSGASDSVMNITGSILEEGGDRVQEKMIMIPEWRYYKMIESYDKAIKEIERLKKALEEAATSAKAKVTH